jgi:hypothetical protein
VMGKGGSATYTATSNAPDKLEWTAAGGTPASGNGGSFTTTFNTTGSKTVTAQCGSNSKSKNVNVVDPCPANTAVVPTFPHHINQGHNPMGASDFGKTTYHTGGITINWNVCLDGGSNQWTVRVQDANQPIDMDTQLPASITQIRVGAPPAGNTTAASYCQQVRDVISCSVNRMCGVTWFDRNIIDVHERTHITQRENAWTTEWANLEPALEAFTEAATDPVCDATTARTRLTTRVTPRINQSQTTVLTTLNNTSAAREAAAQASEAPPRTALIQQICNFGKANGFPACAVCPP